MAYNLKLSIFRISLKKKGDSNNNLIPFNEFFKESYPNLNKKKAYKSFIDEYVNSFGSKFRLNLDGTKGISAVDTNEFTIKSKSNIINGAIIGGQTGILQELFKQNNSEKPTGNLDTDDVATLSYFIKLWTPYDHDSGILMVQSYSNLTVTDLIKGHLGTFFNKRNFSLIFTNYIPNSVKEHYKKNSNVYKVAFVKDSISKGKRKLINPLFAEFDNLQVRIEVSGFKKDVTDFWDKFGASDRLINSNLEDFDIKEDVDFETVAYYKDEKGRKSNTSIKRDLDIKPTIFLNDELKKAGTDLFDYLKIKEHTDFILDEIKNEIGYKIKDD